MGFLATLLAQIAESEISKGISALWSWITGWWSRRKAQQTLDQNQQALQQAEQSGDPDAIAKAGQNSLNNGRDN